MGLAQSSSVGAETCTTPVSSLYVFTTGTWPVSASSSRVTVATVAVCGSSAPLLTAEGLGSGGGGASGEADDEMGLAPRSSGAAAAPRTIGKYGAKRILDVVPL